MSISKVCNTVQVIFSHWIVQWLATFPLWNNFPLAAGLMFLSVHQQGMVPVTSCYTIHSVRKQPVQGHVVHVSKGPQWCVARAKSSTTHPTTQWGFCPVFLLAQQSSWHELWQPPYPVGLSHILPFLMSTSSSVVLNLQSVVTAFMVLHHCYCSGSSLLIHNTA